MARPTITIDWGETVANLSGNALAPRAILKQTAAILAAGARLAFLEEGRNPDGKWRKRSVPNIAGIFADFSAGRPAPLDRRFETGQTLVDRGRLRASVQDENDAEVDISQLEVSLKSNLPYAAKHQEGADDQLVGVITAEFQEWLRRFVMKDASSLGRMFGAEARDDALASFEKNLGYLLNPNMVGTEIRIDIPARPFIEVTPQDVDDIAEMVGVRIARSPEDRA